MRHWVFDLDGTLVDSFGHFFEAIQHIFERHGAVFRDKHRQEALTRPLREFFEANLGFARVPEAMDLLQKLSNEQALRIRPFEGIRQALHELGSGGARLAVWTNRDLESASLILRSSGLGEHFETCVSGTCVSLRKPHPEGLLRIIRGFGCAPEEVAVVGDHEMDMLGAKAAGAVAVRARWHSYWEPEECAHSDHQFDDVARFREWLRSRG